MARTASEMAAVTQAQYFDFTSGQDDAMPKMQIRGFRIVPNQMSGSTMTSTSGGQGVNDVMGMASSSREHSASVTLPMPNELKQTNKFDWSVEDRSLLQNVVGNFNGQQSMSDITSRPGEMIQNVLLRAAESGFDMFGTRTAIRNAGFAINPLKEIFFDGLSVRNFDWTWDLYPRNAQEAESIMKMIRKIRIDAHPEKFSRGINIIPAEFEISWINAKMPQVYKSVCTSLEADYGDGGANFKADGFASFIKLSASFMEIEVLDRLRLEQDEW